MKRPTILLAALALILTTVRADALDPVRIAVSPLHAMAPATLFVRVSVAPNDRNRTLEVVAESENYFRSSEMDLEGKDGPALVTLEFHQVPSGTYGLEAVVTDGGRRLLASSHCEVVVY